MIVEYCSFYWLYGSFTKKFKTVLWILCSRWIGFSRRGASSIWRKRKQTGLVLFYIANSLVLAFIIKSFGKMKKMYFASTVVLDFVGIVWQLIASTGGFRSANMSTMMSSAFKKCRSILTALKFRFFHNGLSDDFKKYEIINLFHLVLWV